MIPYVEWTGFAMLNLEMHSAFRLRTTTYEDDWVRFKRQLEAQNPEALAVFEQYKVWKVTQRLKE